MTYDLKPISWWCDFCEDEVLTDTSHLNFHSVEICRRCEREAEAIYLCPGCGKDKVEHEMMFEACDLCRDCFDAEVAELEREWSPRRVKLIEFLRGLD